MWKILRFLRNSNLTFEYHCEQIIEQQTFLFIERLICKQGLVVVQDKWFVVWKIQYWAKQHGQYRSDNFVIEYIEGAPCWVELVRGVRGPGISGVWVTRIIEERPVAGGKAYIHYNTIKIPRAKHPGDLNPYFTSRYRANVLHVVNGPLFLILFLLFS